MNEVSRCPMSASDDRKSAAIAEANVAIDPRTSRVGSFSFVREILRSPEVKQDLSEFRNDALHDPDAGANKFFGAMHATELPLSLFAGCIALLFIGGGRLSLDAFVFRKRKAAETAAQPAVGAQ